MATTRPVSHLPEELIFKILTLLPVISLLRCRSVCKLWESIISKPEFVEAHLTQKKQQSVALLNVQKRRNGKLYWVDSNEDLCEIHLPPQFNGTNNLVNSCNGLVSIANYPSDVIYLCNPITKRSKILPTPNIQAQPYGELVRVNLGLGFNSISNDYKILRIVFTKGLIDVDSVLQMEVYSANSDSWKVIQVPGIIQSFSYSPENCVHAQPGVLYLEVSLSELLSFDLHNEMFGVYPYPKPAEHQIVSNVFDFQGSVGMIFRPVVDWLVLSLWTLDDVCGKVSWSKKFNLESAADLEICHVYYYLGVGQFVALCTHVDGYIFYAYIKKETKTFPHLSVSFPEVHTVIRYIESLVSLNGFERVLE